MTHIWTAIDASENQVCDECKNLLRARIDFVDGQQLCISCAQAKPVFGEGE